MTLHPLDIPEILGRIVNYLPRDDRVACLRVSKLFYELIIPSVWYRIQVEGRSSSPCYPSGSAVQRNKHHIREISLDGIYPTHYTSPEGYQNLKAIFITGLPTHADDFEQALARLPDLIAANSATLQQITLYMSWQHMTTPQKELWNALEMCTLLDSLSLRAMIVQKDQLQPFLRACGNPLNLKLISMSIPGFSSQHHSSLDNNNSSRENPDGEVCGITLSRPEDIAVLDYHKISLASGFSSHDLAMIVRSCPNLKSIRCMMGGHTFSPRESHRLFWNTLSRDPWTLPQLESLTLTGMFLEDKDIAGILKQTHQLKSFNAASSALGLLSFNELLTERDLKSGRPPRRLCDTVEYLYLTYCREITSSMVQNLLENCSKLVVLSVPKVAVTDIVRGRPWICHRLKELETYIEMDIKDDPDYISEAQWIVYTRLATLTRLRMLTLTKANGGSRTTLDLRLAAGLSLLSSLENLEEISFSGDLHQQMGVDEAVWMLQHWKSLNSFTGFPNRDAKIHRQMTSIMRDKCTKVLSMNPSI